MLVESEEDTHPRLRVRTPACLAQPLHTRSSLKQAPIISSEICMSRRGGDEELWAAARGFVATATTLPCIISYGRSEPLRCMHVPATSLKYPGESMAFFDRLCCLVNNDGRPCQTSHERQSLMIRSICSSWWMTRWWPWWSKPCRSQTCQCHTFAPGTPVPCPAYLRPHLAPSTQL
jgi:hypothetical protein